jgi:farnesyl-diphosphate farnesyltransferase
MFDERPSREAVSFQGDILGRVSRTFALTIPELPTELGLVVGNAYLLCRIADTIEDEPGIPADRKSEFHRDLNRVLAGQEDVNAFTLRVSSALTQATASEKELIQRLPLVMEVTASTQSAIRETVTRCLSIMCEGMPSFQRSVSLQGLHSLEELDRYCYYVAGVVGEMLTDLFCLYSDTIAARRTQLMPLAVSFGQGLQMTNILKDFWEDRARGSCWLPREVFLRTGCDLALVRPDHPDPGFSPAMQHLVAVAMRHLNNALSYSLLIPKKETGIRRFCLWAIGFAVLSLRKLNQSPSFTSGAEVKISRRTVRWVMRAVNGSVRSDRMLRWLFWQASRGLPELAPDLLTPTRIEGKPRWSRID